MWFKGTALWPSEYRNGRITARAATSAALAACALLSAGCIPIVALPTLDSTSRGNVPTAVPSELLVGTSSRIDVLLALGEPDGRGPDDRWFSYASTKTWGTGGVLIVPPLVSGVFAGGESVSRLLITFDDAGSLSEARLESRNCPQAGLYVSAAAATARQANSSTSYCLNPAGTDSPEAKYEETAQLAALRPDPGALVARYERVFLIQNAGPGCKFPDSRAGMGNIILTSRALILEQGTNRSGDDAKPVVLRFDEFDVMPPQRHAAMRWIVLQRNDHTCVFFTPSGLSSVDKTQDRILEQRRAYSALGDL
jgi:outer membrane protein assembly factor BamE (lipoprotein component of BamABCDE complex)